MKHKMMALILILMMGAVSALAQDASVVPLAAVYENAVWLRGLSASPQAITDGTARNYSNLVWSSDGNDLAFVAHDRESNAHLMLYDRASNTVVPVDTNIEDEFPVRFSYDSSQLYYVAQNRDPKTGEFLNMDFYTYNLVPGAHPVKAASFDFGVGCGGGSPYPVDWRYTVETAGLGGFHLVLVITPFGLVHSMDCGGSQTGLLNLQTGDDISLGQINRAVVSADGMKVAGITDPTGDRRHEKLVVVDLQSRAAARLDTAETPDQIAWAEMGSSALFYSVRHQTLDTIPVTAEEQTRVDSVLGYPGAIPYHWFIVQANIHRLELAASAYAIGRMTATQTGLVFSQVPNPLEWFRAIAEGKLDMGDPDKWEGAVSMVTVSLFRLPVSGGEAELLGTDLNQTALNLAAR